MRELLQRLELSLADRKIIQVVGTNGKGSSVAFIESILNANNYSSGLFTSPHLSTARERIRINGAIISEDLFVTAALRVNYLCESMLDQPSFFERMLAMALWVFAKEKVQIIILEAGLGGRLDATTACEAHILGVSTIAFDHQHILGDTLELITSEKIAAARAGQQVISVEQDPKSKEEISKAQKKIGFDLSWSNTCEDALGLFGPHQKINAGLAVALIAKLGLKTSKSNNALGLLQVDWPGRFEIIKKEVPIILDGAHNPSGMAVLSDAIITHPEFGQKACVLVFGSLVGQPHKKIKVLLKHVRFSHIFIHCSKNPRAERAEDLKRAFLQEGVSENIISSLISFKKVISYAKNQGAYVLVCGSLYTVGEARAELLGLISDAALPNF